MAIKVRVLSMLITLHSLGLLFGSLFTYKWYVDDHREVGVFGICETLNKTSVNRMILVENSTAANMHIPFEIDSFLPKPRSFSIFSSSVKNRNKMCYQLLWPITDEAFVYLAGTLRCFFYHTNNSF